MEQLELPFKEYEDKQLHIPFYEEIAKILEKNPRSVEFKFKLHTDLVDVYVGDRLLYKITKEEYEKLTGEL